LLVGFDANFSFRFKATSLITNFGTGFGGFTPIAGTGFAWYFSDVL
jgi:hypothetical protein